MNQEQYRSPHWRSVERNLTHYLKRASDAAGLRWDHDNDAEVADIVDAIRLAVIQEIRHELEPEPEPVEAYATDCCCYEHAGDNPDCPTHGARHAKAAPEPHALHDATERYARTVERVEKHVNERKHLSLVKAGAS